MIMSIFLHIKMHWDNITERLSYTVKEVEDEKELKNEKKYSQL